MDISELKTIMGNRIFALRKDHNYSKKEVREKTGISEQMQKQYEDGSVKKIPSTEILLKLSELYQVPISYFFSDTYDEPIKSNRPRINSIYDVAKTLIDLSQVKGISLVIRKKTETTTVVYHGFDYPEIEEEPYTLFSFSLTDVPELYNKLKSGNCDHDTVKLYEDSILNQFFDKLLTYINLYREEKIDIDDYRTLCEKALNSVKILEKNQRIFEELNFEDFDKDDDNENDLPF